MLLVKLDQFDADDDVSLRIDSNSGDWFPAEDDLQVKPLYYFDTEMVALYQLAGQRPLPTPAAFRWRGIFRAVGNVAG